MSGVYLGEIIAFVIGTAGLILGLAGAYLLIRHVHRKWYWEDEVRKNAMLRAAFKEAGIAFEVNDDGFVSPLTASTPRSSGRARD